MDSKMEKEWKNSNFKKNSHKNLFKNQLKMAQGMAFKKVDISILILAGKA